MSINSLSSMLNFVVSIKLLSLVDNFFMIFCSFYDSFKIDFILIFIENLTFHPLF